MKLLNCRLLQPLQTSRGWLTGTLTSQFYEIEYEPELHWVKFKKKDWDDWECVFTANISAVTPLKMPKASVADNPKYAKYTKKK